MNRLAPLACFGAAVVMIAAVGAVGVWVVVRLGRSPRFRQLIGASERVRATSDKRFFWFGEQTIARVNAARELAAKRHYAMAGDIIRWIDSDGTFELYPYTFDDGDSKTTHILLRVVAADLQLPPFSISTRTFLSARGITFDDEFSARYYVESSDEARVRTLLTPAVRQTIISSNTWRVDSDASGLLFTDLEHTNVEGFERFVDESMQVVRTVIEQMIQAPPFR